MTADLAGFLLAQLDADEAVARAAAEHGAPRWTDTAHCWQFPDDTGRPHHVPMTPGERAHIALHDPAFELDRIAWLRDVVKIAQEAQRQYAAVAADPSILTSKFREALQVKGWFDAMDNTLRRLAQPYRSRPGWRDEWTVGTK